MTSHELAPLPIPFGTKAVTGTGHTWPADSYSRCFWAILSPDGERRIVATSHPTNDYRVVAEHPGYPDAYLMQGHLADINRHGLPTRTASIQTTGATTAPTTGRLPPSRSIRFRTSGTSSGTVARSRMKC